MIPGNSTHEVAVLSTGVRRVLVVDEAAPIRRKLSEILVRSGLSGTQIHAAATADEALESFALDHPDIIFCELVGADPEEGLRMIFEMLSMDPHARIVLVTAEDPDSPLIRKAVRHGVFAIVPKPLRHDRIRQLLAEIEAETGGLERFR